MSVTDKAIRKASAARLLKEFAAAARLVESYRFGIGDFDAAEVALAWARSSSRVRHACLMTAFGF